MSSEGRRAFAGVLTRHAPPAAASAVTALVLLVFIIGGAVLAQDPTKTTGVHKRFEYKLSFRGPHLVQKDGTIPFWEHHGHAIASDESVRITPSLKSKKGSVWSKVSNVHRYWVVEIVFRVAGRGRVGADGLAFWYTEKKGEEGPVFGSNDMWKGLGVFFDSFDNDGLRNNPYIMAMVNNGTLAYDHEADGSSQQIGGCQRDFRNKPFPVRVKIEYYQNALTVFFHNGLTPNPDDYELCMRAEGVELKPDGFFGVSAATGGLADDHDVLSFSTHSLVPIAEKPYLKDGIPDDERLKFEHEFDDYRGKLERAKEDYRKEHPNENEIITDEDKLYEAQDVKELRMIFDGQNEIHRLVKGLLVKLDEVIGRQERELSMLTLINQGTPGGIQSNQGPSGNQQFGTGTFQRHEVDSVLNSQKDISANVRDLRAQLTDLQSRFSGGSPSGHGDSSEIVKRLQDVRAQFDGVQIDVKTLLSKPRVDQTNCPTVSDSCVTPFVLFTFLFGQFVCIIGYLMFRSSRDAAAKKFY